MKYVALLRGIGPGNPQMANSNLRKVCEELGFENVRTFISSGNILFESRLQERPSLEAKIEKALPEELGFTSQTIIRSKSDLDEIVMKNPFAGLTHDKHTSLHITFLKEYKSQQIKAPLQGKGYEIIKVFNGAICFVVDLRDEKTPVIMSLLEKEFEKKVTTRTWNTVSRIHTLL